MSLNRQILKLAIPNIIANISVPLLSIADASVLGHLPSEIYLAAVALGGIVFNFILWGFGFLRMSTTGITSQEFGKKSDRGMSLAFYRPVILALAIGTLIIIFQNYIGYIGFHFIKAEAALKTLAFDYYKTRIYAVPAALINIVIAGWLLGMQDSKRAMILVIIENLLNIGLNVFFVIHLGMKSEGVALGTVIARWVGTLAGILLIFSAYQSRLKLPSKKDLFYASELKKLLSVNFNIFIRTLSIIAVFTWFTYASATESSTVLALNSLLLQFFMIFSFFMDGLAFAGESLTGRFYGEQKYKALNFVVKKSFLWGGLLSFLFSLFYWIGADTILNMLTDLPQLIDKAKEYLLFVIAIPFVSFAAFLWDGIYTGLTETAKMRNIMLFAAFIVFFPTYKILQILEVKDYLWIAFLSFFIARSIGMTIFRPRLR